MKKLILAAAIVLSLSGCGDAANPMLCREAVMQKLDATEVVAIGDTSYRFIARDKEGTIWYAETLSLVSSRVTGMVVIFKGAGNGK